MRKTSLPELVQQLQLEQLKKKDLVVPSSNLRVENGQLVISNVNNNHELSLFLQEIGIGSEEGSSHTLRLDITPVCHTHLCSKTDIPRKYYDRMLIPEAHAVALFDRNVTHWIQQSDKNYFVRMFVNKEENKGAARAFLSDSFKVIDHYDILMTALEAIKNSGNNLIIDSCDLTESKMYVRFVSPETEIEARSLIEKYRVPGTGNNGGRLGIASGIIITNSEVGQGSFSVSPRAIVGACANGMIFQDDQFRKTHLGSRMEEFESIRWSEEAKQKNLELINVQVRDAVRTFASKEYLGKKIAELEQLESPILNHPIDAIKNVCQHLIMSEDKTKSIMNYFMQGADQTRFGITQALTYFAHKDADADQQMDMEIQAVSVLNEMHNFDHEYKEPNRRGRPIKNSLTVSMN